MRHQWQRNADEVIARLSERYINRSICYGKSSPAPAPAPDYTGAATATAAGNLQNSIAAQQGSMVNQVTPYGDLTYNETGSFPDTGNPQYTATTDLTPYAQNTLNSQLDVSNNLASLTQQQLANVNQQYSTPMDLSSIPQVEQQSYADQTALLDPTWKANDQAQAATLANQGITQGSDAYNNAMYSYNQGKNSAYNGAALNAINTAPQTYSLAQQEYEQPLNQLEAIRSGAQIQAPTFQSTPQQQAVPGANLLGAAQDTGTYNQGLYNSQVAQNNATTSGLYGLGASALGAYGSYAGLAALAA